MDDSTVEAQLFASSTPGRLASATIGSTPAPTPVAHPPTRVGIIGFGYWGTNLLRNFSATPDAQVTVLAEAMAERRERAGRQYPALAVVADAHELMRSPDVDAVVIATPVGSHHPLAKAALVAGKHVLLEKPMTESSAHAEELVALSRARGLVLMVDHTFLYTGAVRKLKQLVQDGTLGKIHYLDSTRINLGVFQPDVNVVWDLAPHDVAIMGHLIDERPRSVQAVGAAHTTTGLENIAYLVVHFASGLIAHFNCSWVSPVKVRQMLIGGDRKMVWWNDMEPSEKLRVYDAGYRVASDEEYKSVMIDYRTGDMWAPKVETTEALSLVAGDFVAAIRDGVRPLSDGELGLWVVRVLEAAQLSIREQGREVSLADALAVMT